MYISRIILHVLTKSRSIFFLNTLRMILRSCVPHPAAAKSLQLCPTLCNPIDDCPPGSPVPGILQLRTLEWVAISFSNAWKEKWKWSCCRVRLLVTPWAAAYQAPPSMGFSRQEYWSGLPLPSACATCDTEKKIIVIEVTLEKIGIKPDWNLINP